MRYEGTVPLPSACINTRPFSVPPGLNLTLKLVLLKTSSIRSLTPVEPTFLSMSLINSSIAGLLPVLSFNFAKLGISLLSGNFF